MDLVLLGSYEYYRIYQSSIYLPQVIFSEPKSLSNGIHMTRSSDRVLKVNPTLPGSGQRTALRTTLRTSEDSATDFHSMAAAAHYGHGHIKIR